MMTTHSAIKLVADALREKDLGRRIQACARVLSKATQIPQSPDLPWDVFVEQVLKDGLASGKLRNGRKLLGFDFSAEEQAKILPLAIATFLALDDVDAALKWIETMVYVFGQRSVQKIVKNPEFRQLHRSKKFQKLVGPRGRIAIASHELDEAIKEWSEEDYDNIKDVIFVARSLLKEIPKTEKALYARARRHHDAVMKAAREMIQADPGLGEYLKPPARR